ncbi:uncharacterized protein V2V93DRAFT_373305 [Kockiozyma suomiensis]|uniref:uncharacterized protein n=1 Tax=Kockiozyma suomiensis TaxID=1337062 RepID=UPI00334342B3
MQTRSRTSAVSDLESARQIVRHPSISAIDKRSQLLRANGTTIERRHSLPTAYGAPIDHSIEYTCQHDDCKHELARGNKRVKHHDAHEEIKRKRGRHSIATSTVSPYMHDMQKLFPPIVGQSAPDVRQKRHVQAAARHSPKKRQFGVDVTNLPSSPPIQRKKESIKMNSDMDISNCKRLCKNSVQLASTSNGDKTHQAHALQPSLDQLSTEESIELRDHLDKFLGEVMEREIEALTRNNAAFIRILSTSNAPEKVREECRSYLRRQDQMRQMIQSFINSFVPQIGAMKSMLGACATYSNNYVPILAQYLTQKADGNRRARGNMES